ncbi:hypothetical protein AWH56_26790 [Anaerobacillus isosaccharinicus]|uniref:Uncharacterized protein n=1 Tax=Anaerobacillus isosaccharinicus TaxID=1532552 RepID=A0AC62A4C7_9BACI|nr:hypothetical protein [Anaerobacillus isosaccharinicus]
MSTAIKKQLKSISATEFGNLITKNLGRRMHFENGSALFEER